MQQKLNDYQKILRSLMSATEDVQDMRKNGSMDDLSYIYSALKNIAVAKDLLEQLRPQMTQTFD